MKFFTRVLVLCLCLSLMLGGMTLAAAEEKKYDFGGMTISLCNWWGKDLTPGLSDENDRFIARIAEVEKKFNVKFEYRKGPEDYYDNMVTTIMAGEPYADLMWAFQWNFPGWEQAGAAYDVTELAAELGIDFSKYSPIAMKEGNYNDHIYGFNKEMTEVNCMVAFNKRLLEEAGLESPYDLITKGEWTFAKLQEYAKKLTKKDASGVVTQWGFSAYDPALIGPSLVNSNNGAIVQYVDGKPTFSLDSPNALEALNLLSEMCTVDKTVFIATPGSDWDVSTKMFIQGQIGLMRCEQWIIECFNAWGMEDEFGLVPFPMGPQDTKYRDDVSSQNVYFIPSCVDKERAKAALLVYDALYDDLYPELTTQEKYESKFMKYCRDEESIKNMGDIYYGRTSDVPVSPYKTGVDTDLMNKIFTAIMDGSSTPAAAVAEYKPAIQAAMDKANGY